MKKLASCLLALALLGAAPAFADDDELERDDDEIEQVIPPAKVEGQVDQSGAEPLDISRIEVTTETPADQFLNATTPLYVALFLGTIGLVVVTLVTQGRGNSSSD
ncbi:MAG: hypothetical protein VW500_00335 [Aquiluna sp.]